MQDVMGRGILARIEQDQLEGAFDQGDLIDLMRVVVPPFTTPGSVEVM